MDMTALCFSSHVSCQEISCLEVFFFFFEIKKSKEKKKTILQLHEATGHLKILKLEKMMIYLNVLESVFCLKL